jgi:hypothetical protein
MLFSIQDEVNILFACRCSKSSFMASILCSAGLRSRTTARPKKVKIMTVKLSPNEVVLKAGDTNQVVDNVTVEGKLIVTNQRLYFKTLKEETERFNLEILFENIREVIYFSKGLFSTKGLNVITNDGSCFSFPLKKRDEFGLLINKMY